MNTLIEVLNGAAIGNTIQHYYNSIDSIKPVQDGEKQIFQNILIYKVKTYEDLDVLLKDYDYAVEYIQRFIISHVVELTISLRQLIEAVNNEKINTTHTQEKFNPVNNKEDINKAPVFNDTATFSDITNYLSKVDYIKNLKILKDWSIWVCQVIWNF